MPESNPWYRIRQFASIMAGKHSVGERLARRDMIKNMIRDASTKLSPTRRLSKARQRLTQKTGEMFQSLQDTAEYIKLEERAIKDVEADNAEIMYRYNLMAQFAAEMARRARRRNNPVMARLDDLQDEIRGELRKADNQKTREAVEQLLRTGVLPRDN